MENETVPILERAKQALSVRNDAELSRELGITTAAMSGYKKRQSLPMEQCIKIAEQTGVSLDWLILGKGEMRPQARPLREEEPDYNDGDAAWVPLYDVTVSAGNGIDVISERILRRIPFSRRWLKEEGLSEKDLACVTVEGNSMYPTLHSGDTVLINRADTDGDGVYVLRIGNALRVKRLQWLSNGDLRISSDNSMYSDETVNPDELDTAHFAIIGACYTRISHML